MSEIENYLFLKPVLQYIKNKRSFLMIPVLLHFLFSIIIFYMMPEFQD